MTLKYAIYGTIFKFYDLHGPLNLLHEPLRVHGPPAKNLYSKVIINKTCFLLQCFSFIFLHFELCSVYGFISSLSVFFPLCYHLNYFFNFFKRLVLFWVDRKTIKCIKMRAKFHPILTRSSKWPFSISGFFNGLSIGEPQNFRLFICN